MKQIIIPLLILATISAEAQLPADHLHVNPKAVQLPYNMLIKPAGIQIVFGNKTLENHALDGVL